MVNSLKRLVVGIGNSLRSDDGVGPVVADAIQKKNFPDTDVQVTLQLNVEWIDEFERYDQVFLVDASEGTAGVQLVPVSAGRDVEGSSSHHCRPDLLLALMQQFHQKTPTIHVCTIQGENFELGDTLSPAVKKRAEQAVQLLTDTLQRP